MKLPFPVIGQSIERNVHAMRETLFRVFEALDLPHHVAGGAWEYLQARYTEPGRHYHTLGHLVYMFSAAADIGWLESLERREILAILYHDAVYEVGAKDNEEQSAGLLVDLFQPIRQLHVNSVGLDNHPYQPPELKIIDDARTIIRDTARYLEDKLPPEAEPSHRVLDLDLSIFAADWVLFDMSNQLVRKELGIDHATHATFLSKFLEREHIYRTAEARDAWETAARENIRRYSEEAQHADEA